MRRAAVGVVVIAAALVASLIAGGHPRRRDSTGAATVAKPPLVGGLPAGPPADRAALVADLDLAQKMIDDASSPTVAVAAAGRFEQLATIEVARRSRRVQRIVVAELGAPASAMMRANLQAATALSDLDTPHKSLPPWKIIQPPEPRTLLGYFKAAQAQFGVPWEDLAAIELIETDFGRVQGLSTAGAEGPMQFLPATWAEYGRGAVRNQHDAIFGAARYLVASGARNDIAGALYHYNPSADYVHAVEDYAGRMHADPRAYYGYYYWEVILAHVGGPLILPPGFPRVRPSPLPF
jgi:hypothetical protein